MYVCVCMCRREYERKNVKAYACREANALRDTTDDARHRDRLVE